MGDSPMQDSDYTDHYDPKRNPNSAMLRVLSNAGYDPNDHSPKIVSTPLPDGVDSETPTVVTVAGLTGKLVREAERAGFSFVNAEWKNTGIEVMFRVVRE